MDQLSQTLELEDEVVSPVTEGSQEDDVVEDEKEAQRHRFDVPLPASRVGGAPSWAKIPKGMKFPRARQSVFMKFLPQWTDTPQKGERQCMCWGLTDTDEKMAIDRAMGDNNRAAAELTKQMIRSIDGVEVACDGLPGTGNIDQWWREIGGRCRQMLVRIYTQLHTLSEEERKHFFEECISVVIPPG